MQRMPGMPPSSVVLPPDIGAMPQGGTPDVAPVEPVQEPVVLNVIDKTRIDEALGIYKDYKAAKGVLEKRIQDNEQWWQDRYTPDDETSKKLPFQVKSAWMFSSLRGTHASLMDGFPEANILPREPGDEQAAQILSNVMPAILERNDFKRTYNQLSWYKLKQPAGVYGVFWDGEKENGLGDISIKKIDLLNVFWAPGIIDIQDSPHFFHLEAKDNKWLERTYTQMKGHTGGDGVEIVKYANKSKITAKDESVVFDWYYKIKTGSKSIVHYCKFCNGVVLYATENDPAYAERGLYDHGMYPFEFDQTFPVEGEPVGFSLLEIMRSPQEAIDRLGRSVVKMALMRAIPRWLVPDNAVINEENWLEWDNPFIKAPGERFDQYKQVTLDPIGGDVFNARNELVNELKETSGNSDVTQGVAPSGVTSGVALATLHEAGSKNIRDMLNTTYDSFTRVCYLCIELIRQFYTLPRAFRITGQTGEPEFVRLGGEMLNLGDRIPVFDIVVNPQKANPYTKMAQNEFAKELYGLQLFNPANAEQALMVLEMMDFPDKQKIIDMVRKKAILFGAAQAMANVLIQIMPVLQANPQLFLQADMALKQLAQSGQLALPQPQPVQAPQSNESGSTADKARKQVAAATDPTGGMP